MRGMIHKQLIAASALLAVFTGVSPFVAEAASDYVSIEEGGTNKVSYVISQDKMWKYDVIDYDDSKCIICPNDASMKTGDVVVPEMVDGKLVVAIGSNAWSSNAKTLTSVRLPESVKEIGGSAFSGCAALKSVNLNNVKKIDSNAFKNCSALETFDFNSEIKSIGSNAFYGCVLLKSIDGIKSIDTIEANAFDGCSLENVYLEHIGTMYKPFDGCETLKSVEIKDIDTLGEHSFSSKMYASSVKIGNVGSITDDSVFIFCPNLVSIEIDNIEDKMVSKVMVEDCKKLERVAINCDLELVGTEFKYSVLGKYTKNVSLKNVKEICADAFYDCTALEHIKLTGTTKIGNEAFYNCSSLVTVEIPNITEIGSKAFRGCTALESIKLNGTTKIGNEAFYNCSSLVDIEMPNITEIPVNAFNGCTSLKNIELTDTTKIGSNAFKDCSSLVAVQMPNIKEIGESAFSGCTSLKEVNLDTIEIMDKNTRDAFAYCYNLTSLTIPSTVKEFNLNCAPYQFNDMDEEYLKRRYEVIIEGVDTEFSLGIAHNYKRLHNRVVFRMSQKQQII